MTARTRAQNAIRPATGEDYETIAALTNAVYSDYATTADTIRYGDEHRDPKCRLGRFIAERDGEAVGLAEYGQSARMYHPRKFGIDISVPPRWQGQGIGAALHDHLLDALEPFSPLSVVTSARADWTRKLAFLEARGYAEVLRSWESRLTVADFDPTPFAEAEARTLASGIAIRTMAELADDPARDRKLYDLDQEVWEDVPTAEPHTPIEYGQYIERLLHDPDLLPDAYFVAIDTATGEWAGMGQLWRSQADDDLYNGLTGVRRAYRRRGIALAVKLRGIAYARAHGRPTIKTWNESNNRAMLAINEALGFVKQPAWIEYRKTLRDDETATAPGGEGEG